MNKNIVIIILSILLVGVSGFVVYDKYIKDDTKNENSVLDNKKEDGKTINSTSIELYKFEEVIENELSGLEAFNSLSEVPNENKMVLLYNLYSKNKEKTPETFTKSDLEKAKESSSLSNMEINYDYICDMYGIYTIKKDIVGYEYDKNSETYTYTNALGHGGVAEGIIYKKLIDFKYQDNKYILKYKYMFYNGGSVIDKESTSIYYTVTDLLNNKTIKDFNNNKNELASYNQFDAISYIKNNYSSLESNMKEFTYEFEIINNNKIVLSNYYVK